MRINYDFMGEFKVTKNPLRRLSKVGGRINYDFIGEFKVTGEPTMTIIQGNSKD